MKITEILNSYNKMIMVIAKQLTELDYTSDRIINAQEQFILNMQAVRDLNNMSVPNKLIQNFEFGERDIDELFDEIGDLADVDWINGAIHQASYAADYTIAVLRPLAEAEEARKKL